MSTEVLKKLLSFSLFHDMIITSAGVLSPVLSFHLASHPAQSPADPI